MTMHSLGINTEGKSMRRYDWKMTAYCFITPFRPINRDLTAYITSHNNKNVSSSFRLVVNVN